MPGLDWTELSIIHASLVIVFFFHTLPRCSRIIQDLSRSTSLLKKKRQHHRSPIERYNGSGMTQDKRRQKEKIELVQEFPKLHCREEEAEGLFETLSLLKELEEQKIEGSDNRGITKEEGKYYIYFKKDKRGSSK